ncbi:hypothetical protein OAW23_07610 [Flavobacteriales bacterium]|nr:hypothetical protein [Flavobacteriales bacterium]
MRFEFLLLVLVLMCSCEEIQTDAPPVHSPNWLGNHVLDLSLGDTITPSQQRSYLSKHGLIHINADQMAIISQIEAQFCVDAESPLNYSSVQEYYNKLFEGEEVDEDWSHWSFSNNHNVPGELFLFSKDTTCLEIITYLAKQK